MGFPGSSAGKESACSAGDPSLIPGSGRSPGERVGYPLQYSWASLVVQSVENLPPMQEIWVWSLSWDDPLEEGMATYSNILAWRIPMDRGAWWATVHGVAKGQTQLSDWAQHSGVRRSIPVFRLIPAPSPFVSIRLFFMSVSLFLLCKWDCLCQFFSDSAYVG